MNHFLKSLRITIFTLLTLSNIVFAKQPDNMITLNMPQYSYSIQYPSTWEYKDLGKGLVVFNGKTKDAKEKIMTNIQTIATTLDGGHYPTVKTLMDDLWKEAIKHDNDTKFLMRKDFEMKNAQGVMLKGEETTLTFYEEKKLMKHWQIMLMSEDGMVFQTFAYRTTEKEFDANIDTAKKMLTSWKI